VSAEIERSAGGVVVRSSGEGWKVLVIRDPYRNWGLPKGHVEGSESSEEAAVREVLEETGLEAQEVGPEIATVDWFFTRKGNRVHKFCTFFLMHAPEGEAVPQLEEGITACEWVPLLRAAERVTYGNAREVVRACEPLLKELSW